MSSSLICNDLVFAAMHDDDEIDANVAIDVYD
jgi:hypothetical protein